MAQSDLDLKETALKEDLKFYFMNPCDKYRARHQIPWKLALQILKIVMVTSQVIFTLLLLLESIEMACRRSMSVVLHSAILEYSSLPWACCSSSERRKVLWKACIEREK